MKKVLAVLAVAALAGVGTIATATNADAQYYHRHRGGGIVPFVGGLAAGAIIGGAIANSRPAYAYPPGYYAPGYAPGYAPAPAEYDEPVCTIQQQQYWDGVNWRVRNVQVCN